MPTARLGISRSLESPDDGRGHGMRWSGPPRCIAQLPRRSGRSADGRRATWGTLFSPRLVSYRRWELWKLVVDEIAPWSCDGLTSSAGAASGAVAPSPSVSATGTLVVDAPC